jgi:hypothetical protein
LGRRWGRFTNEHYSHVTLEENNKAVAAALGLLGAPTEMSQSNGPRRLRIHVDDERTERKSPEFIGACWSGKRDSNPRHPAWESRRGSEFDLGFRGKTTS